MAGRHLVENPAEVSAADLADLGGREALAEHLRDGRLEESAGQAGPGGVGGLAGPGGQDVGVGADADVVDADGVRQRLDARDVLAHRVGQFGPHADHAAGVRDHAGVVLADQPRGHHFRHPGVLARPRVEAGVGDDHRLRGHLERARARSRGWRGRGRRRCPAGCTP